MGVKPSTKTAVYSNNLNKEEAYRIQEHCSKEGINAAFGIGTNFSNDVLIDGKPLNIVIKMVSAQASPDSDRWIDTVKLSDDTGKNTGKSKVVQLCKDTLDIKEEIKLEKDPA